MTIITELKIKWLLYNRKDLGLDIGTISLLRHIKETTGVLLDMDIAVVSYLYEEHRHRRSYLLTPNLKQYLGESLVE